MLRQDLNELHKLEDKVLLVEMKEQPVHLELTEPGKRLAIVPQDQINKINLNVHSSKEMMPVNRQGWIVLEGQSAQRHKELINRKDNHNRKGLILEWNKG